MLERRLLPKVWGGQKLRDLLGIALPSDEPIGESWELFDRPDGASKLRGSDTTIADLTRRDASALVGDGVPLGPGGSFPLMLKFLDAREKLSLQVHPDAAAAQGSGDGPKDECCVVLHADGNARFAYGVQPGVSREEFLRKIDAPEVEELMYWFRPEDGDVVHIPPGTPHGIGPGVFTFEVQQNSDLTYRFHDWGRSRQLHTDESRGVVDVVETLDRPVQRTTALPDGGELLVAGPHFTLRRYELDRGFELATDGRFLTITVLGGGGALRWPGGESALSLAKGDTGVVPACVKSVTVEPDDHIDLMVCGPGAR